MWPKGAREGPSVGSCDGLVDGSRVGFGVGALVDVPEIGALVDGLAVDPTTVVVESALGSIQ